MRKRTKALVCRPISFIGDDQIALTRVLGYSLRDGVVESAIQCTKLVYGHRRILLDG